MLRHILHILIGCSFVATIGALKLPAEPYQPKKVQPALRFWNDVPDQAEVVAATYLGGKGHEWLVGGGFQPDGTIILAGNVRGPVFEMPVAEQVIGNDLDKPSEPKPVPLLDRGQQLWRRFCAYGHDDRRRCLHDAGPRAIWEGGVCSRQRTHERRLD